MLRIKSSLLAGCKSLFQVSILLATFLVIGFKANAQISATISPQPVGDVEFCTTTSGTAQNFVVTASTSCSGNPNALRYQWYIGHPSVGSPLASGGGSGYNSGTAATLTVTDLQAMFSAGLFGCDDTLWCRVEETASGCADVEIVGGWVFVPVTAAPSITLTGDQTVCQGTPVVWDLDVTGPTPCSGRLTVDWTRKDFSTGTKATRTDNLAAIAAGVDTSFTFSGGSNTLSSDQDTIIVEVENRCGATSDTSVLTVVPIPNLAAGSNVNICGSAVSPQNISYTVSNAVLDAASGGGDVDWTVAAVVTGSDNPTRLALQALIDANLTGTGNGVTNIDVTSATTLNPGNYTITFQTITKDAASPAGSPACPRTLNNQRITLTVYPEPTVEFSTNAVSMCEDATGNSFDIEINDATYGSPTTDVNWQFWFTEAGGSVSASCTGGGSSLIGTTTGSGNTTLTVSLDGLDPGIYTFKLDSIKNTTNGCVGSVGGTDSITIIVDPKPTAVLSKTSEAVCEGDSGSFVLTVSDAQSCTAVNTLTDFDWSISYTDAAATTAIASVGGTSTATNLNGSGNGTFNIWSNDGGSLAPGTWSFNMTSIASTSLTTACSRTLTNNKSYTLTVNPEPVLNASVSSEDICEGASGEEITVNVTNAELSGVGQAWTVTYTQEGRSISNSCGSNVNPGLIPNPLSGTGNNTLTYSIPSNLPVGKYRYIFTAITNTSGSCSAPMTADTVEFQIDPIPVVSFVADSLEMCENNSGNTFDFIVDNTTQCADPATGGTIEQGWTVNLTNGTALDSVTYALGAGATTKSGSGDSTLTWEVNAALPVGEHFLTATAVTNDSSAVGCNETISTAFRVLVEPRPRIAFTTDVVEVCEGSSGTISVQVENAALPLALGGGQDWEVEFTEEGATLASGCTSGTATSNVLGSTGKFTGNGNGTTPFTVPSTLSPGIYKFYLTKITNTDGPCTGFTDTFSTGRQDTLTLIVNPRPFASIVETSASICESDSTPLTIEVSSAETCDDFGSTTEVSWTLTGTDAVSASHAFSITGTGDSTLNGWANALPQVGAGVWNFTIADITAGTGCDSSVADTFVLTVNPEPEVTFTSTSLTICEREPGSTISASITNANLSGVGQNWTVHFTETSGTTTTGCAGGSASNILGASGTFSGNGNSITPVTFDIPATLAPGIYTFKLDSIFNTATNCKGTLGTNDSFTLIVNPKPIYNIVQTSAVLCEGDSAMLDVTVSNTVVCTEIGVARDSNWTITYSDLVGSNIATLSGKGDSTVKGWANVDPVGGLAAGTHLFTASQITGVGGCDSLIADTFELTINPRPTAEWSETTPLEVCEHNLDSFELEIANATVGTTDFNWEVSFTEISGNLSSSCNSGSGAEGSFVGLTASPLSGSGDSTLKFYVADNLEPGQYTFVISSVINTTSTCTGSVIGNDTIVINVRPQPVAAISPLTASICEEDKPTFNIQITNSRYCPSVNSASIDAQWTLDFNDGVESNVTTTITKNGNSTEVVTANSLAPPGLDPGVYEFDLLTIQNTTPGAGCASAVDVTGDSLYTLTVNPRPDVQFDKTSITICEGEVDSFKLQVSNAALSGSGVSWSVNITENSGNITTSCAGSSVTKGIIGTTVTGSGNDTTTYVLPSNLEPGIYNYIITTISNTDATCVGEVLANDSITITVNPKPVAVFSDDTVTVCENDNVGGAFLVTVSNTEHCAALTGSTSDVNWQIFFTDDADSDFPVPFTGTGDGSFGHIVNSTPAKADGFYNLTIDSIVNTTHGCTNDDDTTLVAEVKGVPVLTIVSHETPVCNGNSSEVIYNVTGIDATTGWSFTHNIGTGAQTVSGTGPTTGNDTFYTSPFGSSGAASITFTAITTTGAAPLCVNSTVVASRNVTVLDNPDVTSISFNSGIDEICSGDSAQIDMTVAASSAGRDWIVYYSVGGVVDSTTGTSDGIFTFYTAGQTHADANGVFDTLDVTIDSIKWIATPFCEAIPPSANTLELKVKPLPTITIDADSNVCVNSPATVDYTIGGVRGTDGWFFRWTNTSPSNGPNNVFGAGAFSGDFTTPNLTPAGGLSDVQINSIQNTTTGCSAIVLDTATVRIDRPSEAGTIQQNYTLCEDNPDIDTIRLIGSRGTVRWDSSDNQGFTWYTTGKTDTGFTFQYPKHTHRWKAYVTNGACPTDSAGPIIVYVYPKPEFTLLSLDNELCVGTDPVAQIQITGVENSQFWKLYMTVDGTLDTIDGKGSKIINYTFNGLGTTPGIKNIDFTGILNTFSGCDTFYTVSDSVAIIANPVAGTLAPAADTFCYGSSATLNWTGASGNVDRWEVSTDTGATWATLRASANNLLYNNIIQTTWFRAIIKNAPCTAEDTSNVSIISVLSANPLAEWVPVPNTETHCYDETATLTDTFEVSGTNGARWNAYFNEGDSTGIVLSGIGDGRYTYTTMPGSLKQDFDLVIAKIELVSGTVICEKFLGNTSTLSIDVIPRANATIVNSSLPSESCEDETVKFDVNVSGVEGSDNWELIYTFEGDVDTLTGSGTGTFSVTPNATTTASTASLSLDEITNKTQQTSGGLYCTTSLTETASWTVYEKSFGDTAQVQFNYTTGRTPADTICYGEDVVLFLDNTDIVADTVLKWQYTNASLGGVWRDVTSYPQANAIPFPQYLAQNLTETTLFRAQVQNGTCAPAFSEPVEVVVLPLPEVTINNTKPTLVCEEGDVELSVTVSGVSDIYTGNDDWTIYYNVDGTSYNFTGSGNGTFTDDITNITQDVTVTLDSIISNGMLCQNTGLSEVLEIDIIDLPTATVNSAPSELCHNSSVRFSVDVSQVGTTQGWTLKYRLGSNAEETVNGTGPGTFNFTTGATVTNVGTTPAVEQLILTSITNTSLNPTSGAACNVINTDTADITVYPVSDAKAATADTAICKGTDVDVFAAADVVGTIVGWEYRNASTSNVWTTINSSATSTYTAVNVTENTDYRVIVKSGPCSEDASDFVRITIEPTPEVVINNTKPTFVCEEGTVTLSVDVSDVTAGASGSDWTINFTVDGADSTLTGSGNGTFTKDLVNITQDVEVELVSIVSRGASGMKCDNMSLTDKLQIDVIDLPIATINSSPAELCHNSTVNFSVDVSNIGSTQSWSLVYRLDNNAATTVTGTGSGTFNFTTSATTNNVSGVTGAEIDSLFLVSITNTGLTPTSGAACNRTDLDTATINVYPVSDAKAATADTAICKGTDVDVFAAADVVGTVVGWEYRNASTSNVWTTINSSATSTYTAVNVTENTDYRVIVKSGPCSEDASDFVRITIEPTPEVVINNTKPTLVCEEGTVTLSVDVSDVTAGASGSDWTINFTVDGADSTLTGSGNGTFTKDLVNITQDVEVELVSIVSRGASGMKCDNMSLTDKLQIDVIDLPIATINSSPAELCHDNNVNFSVDVSNIGSTQSWSLVYRLDNNAVETVSGTGSGTFNFTSVAKTNNVSGVTGAEIDSLFLVSITNTGLTPTSGAACNRTDLDTATINVYPVSDAKAATADTAICKGTDVDVFAAADVVGTVVGWEYRNASTSNVWTSINSSATSTYTAVNVTENTDYRVIVKSGPCSEDASDFVRITIEPTPEVVINNTKPTLVCEEGTVTLSVDVSDVTAGASGSDWTINFTVDGADSTLTGSGNGTFTKDLVNITQDVEVELVSIVSRGASGMKCDNMSLTDKLQIDVIDLPIATINSSPAELCHDNNVNFSVDVSNIGSTQSWSLVYRLDNNAVETVSGTGSGTFNFTSVAKTNNVSGVTGAEIDSLFLVSITNTGLTPTSGAACNRTDLDTATINVYPVSDAKAATADTAICKGTDVDVFAAADVVGTVVGWEYRNASTSNVWTSINSSATSTYTAVNVTENTDYRVIVKSGPCSEDASDFVRITIEPTPEVVINNTKPTLVCEEGTVTLSVDVSDVTAGASGSDWTINFTVDGADSTLTGSGNGTFTKDLVNITQDVEVELVSIVSRGAAGMKCDNMSLTDKLQIDVIDLPIATINSSPAELCHNSTVSFSVDVSNIGSTQSWSLVYRLDNNAPTTVTGTGSGTFNFTTSATTNNVSGVTGAEIDSLFLVSITNTGLTPTSGAACNRTDLDTATINVYPVSDAKAATADTAICKGTDVDVFAAADVVGTVVGWEYRNASTSNVWTSINSSATSTYTAVNVTENTDYRVIVKSGPCSEDASDFVRITIEPTPEVVINNTKPTLVCEEGTVTLSVDVSDVTAGASGSDWTINFTVDGADSTLTGSGNGTFTKDLVNITQDVEVELVSIVSRGASGMKCDNMSLTDKLQIDVIDLPIATINSSPAELCHNSTVNFSVDVSNIGSTQSWSLVYRLDNNAATTVTGTGSGTFNFTTSATTNNVSGVTGAEIDSLFLVSITNTGLTPTSGAACNRTDLDTATINVYPVSDAKAATADTAICKGTDVDVFAAADVVGTIVGWEYRNASTSNVWTSINSSATSTYTAVNVTENTDYRVIVKSGPCSEDASDFVRITIEPTPEVVINNTKPTLVCEEGTVTLSVDVSDVTAGASGSDWTINFTVDGADSTLTGSGNGTFTKDLVNITQDVEVELVSIVSRGAAGMKCDNMSLTDKLQIDVIDLPIATINSSPAELCHNSTVSFSVDVSNIGSTQSWSLVYRLDNNAVETVSGTGSGTFNFTSVAKTNNVSGVTGAEIDSLFLVSITNTGLTPTSGAACNRTDLDTATINVYPVSDAKAATADTAICKGTDVDVFAAADVVGTVVGWEYRNASTSNVWTSINSSATSTYTAVNVTENTDYRVIVKSGPCSEDASDFVRITIEPTPEVVINNTKPTLVCEEGTVILSVTSSNVTSGGTGTDWTLTYTVDGTQDTLWGTGNGTFTKAITNITQDVEVELVSIESRGASGMKCDNMSLTDKLQIDVIDLPIATINSSPAELCHNSTVNFSVDVSNIGSTQSWSLVYRLDNNAATTVTGTGSGTFNFTTSATTNNVSGVTGAEIDSLFLVSITNTGLTPTSGAACSRTDLDTATINVYPVSDAGTASGDDRVCFGTNSGTVSVSNIVGEVVKWQFNDGSGWTDINSSASNSFSYSNLTTDTRYRAVVKSGPCSEDISNVVTISIQPLPTVTITNSKPTVICKDDVVTLNYTVANVANGGSGTDWTLNYEVNGTSQSVNGSGNGTFSTSLGAIGINSTVELVSIVSRGSAGMQCENYNLTDKLEIKVNDIPQASITASDDSLCNGSTGNITLLIDNVKVGESWTVTYNVGSSTGLSKTGVGPGAFTLTTPVLTTGTSHTTVDVELTNIVNTSITPNCNQTLDTTISIVVSPTTVGGTLTPATAFGCYGDNSGTITLSGHIGTIKWWEYSTDGGNTWTVTSNNDVTLDYNDLLVTTSYRVWVQSEPCAGEYSTISTITIYPQPEATISGSPRVCPNEEAVFTLTVTNVPSGEGWELTFDENGTTRTLRGVGSGNFDLTTNGYPYTTTPSTITVTLESIQNLVTLCINDDLNSSAVAIITPNPDADFSVENTCQDTAVIFENLSNIVEGSIAGYKWYFGDGDSSIAVSPSHMYDAPGTYTVRLIAASENGCTGEITKQVTIYDVPEADFNFTNVCENTDFTPTDASTITNGSIVAWNWNFGDNTTSTLQNPTHNYAAAGNYPVTLTVTSDNGCSNSITQEVTIWTLPDANFDAEPVCEEQPMDFRNQSAIAYGSMTYEWDFAGQGNSTDTDPTFTFTGNGNFNVKLVATSNNGCKDSITSTVTVWPKPVASFTVADVCIGETSMFVNGSTVSSGTIDEYFWDFGDATFSTGANPDHTYADANDNGYTVSLRVVTDKGCVDTVSGPAIVWQLPEVDITADQTEFCDGDSALLTANSNQNVTSYRWSTEETTQSITVKRMGWYSVTVEGDQNRGGCFNSDSIFITVWENPVVDAGPDSTIYKGESITLQATATGGTGEPYFWQWSPLTYLNDPNRPDATAERMEQTTTYTVTVTDDNGCTDEDDVTITILDEFKLRVYNVVTPNGDNLNDTWIIDNIWAYPEAEVRIYNRYGMLVYGPQTGYQNDWNGLTNDGKELPDGPYYYVITLPGDDNAPSYSGSITLMRSTQ
jgi:gliding motility-associated-like protein